MGATMRDDMNRFDNLSGTVGHGEGFCFENSRLSQFLGSIGPLLAQKEGLLLCLLLLAAFPWAPVSVHTAPSACLFSSVPFITAAR